MMIKVAILYYSRTGNTEAAAELIKEGILKAGDFDVKLISVENIDKKFIMESQAVVFGSPTYSANFAWPLKKWFDEEARDYNLAGKLAANFTTGNFIGGGEDAALVSMANHELVRAMLVYSGGGPLTHVGVVVIQRGDKAQQERAVAFGERIGRKVKELFG